MSRETALEERSRFVSSEQLGTDRQPAPRQEPALQPGERAARVARATLLLALAVGAVLRLWQLNRLGYNSDEAVYAGQAAAIVGDPGLKPFFPVFRAHPLLFQFLVSLSFLAGVRDWVGRLWAVAFGLATIYLVFRLGRLLYGSPTGALAATFLALMPYHVIVSRQVLLDGPMTFFATLTLYALARFGLTQQPGWLYVTGATMGLTVLTKETSILLVGAAYAFLALSPEIRLRVRDVVLSLACLALVVAPFPASLLLAGGQKTAKSYLIWQLFRRPNHGWDFYASVVPSAIGPAIVLLALAGLWLLRQQRSWRERLLCAWIVVPCVFFELWPVKGFQYLLPIAPAVALLAARTLTASYRPLGPLQARPWAARLGRAARFAAILAVLV
ncbi:MAG: glycosyltransferase family 39 protein, partial [Thermomicrobiaceae bacterium]|nr:glycosyltransferase family 39 protein [Thermomicrobiaceae bacterium]